MGSGSVGMLARRSHQERVVRPRAAPNWRTTRTFVAVPRRAGPSAAAASPLMAAVATGPLLLLPRRGARLDPLAQLVARLALLVLAGAHVREQHPLHLRRVDLAQPRAHRHAFCWRHSHSHISHISHISYDQPKLSQQSQLNCMPHLQIQLVYLCTRQALLGCLKASYCLMPI